MWTRVIVALVAALTMLASQEARSRARTGLPQTEPALGASVPVQDPPAPPPNLPPPSRHVVRIDAIVTNHEGQPILDLQPEDFELRDDGTPQIIEAAELKTPGALDVTLSAPAALARSAMDEGAATPGTGTRVFAVFLDEYHVSAGIGATRVREALTRFVDEEVRHGDLAVVMKPLDRLTTIRLTHDRDAMHRAIASFAGLKGHYTARTDFERELMSKSPAQIDATRAQIVVSALRGLAAQLGRLGEGRKAIVLVSEGFVHRAPRGAGVLPDTRSVVRAATRAGVSIHPIVPSLDLGGMADRGHMADAPDGRYEAPLAMLRRLADQTSGRAVWPSDDVTSGLRRMAQDLDAYYRLTYRALRPGDGGFHTLEVRVNRPGAEVHAPTGYWAPPPLDRRHSGTRAPRAEPLMTRRLRPQHRSSLIQPWFGISRASDGRARITFAWTPSTRVSGRKALPAATAIVFTATSLDGARILERRVMPARPGGPAGDSTRVVFDAPPGLLAIDLSIRSADETVLDVDVRHVEVPNLIGPRIVIAAPGVFRTRTALEFRRIGLDADALPTVARTFSRTERLLLRVPAYGPGNATPLVTARLVNAVGQPMHELREIPARVNEGITQFDLPLGWLAPGQYGIRITATSGDERAVEQIPIRVVN